MRVTLAMKEPMHLPTEGSIKPLAGHKLAYLLRQGCAIFKVIVK
jgi:hypothetical protein